MIRVNFRFRLSTYYSGRAWIGPMFNLASTLGRGTILVVEEWQRQAFPLHVFQTFYDLASCIKAYTFFPIFQNQFPWVYSNVPLSRCVEMRDDLTQLNCVRVGSKSKFSDDGNCMGVSMPTTSTWLMLATIFFDPRHSHCTLLSDFTPVQKTFTINWSHIEMRLYCAKSHFSRIDQSRLRKSDIWISEYKWGCVIRMVWETKIHYLLLTFYTLFT